MNAVRTLLAALIVFALCIAGTVHGTADANAATPAVAGAHVHDSAENPSHDHASEQEGREAHPVVVADEEADCSGSDHCVGCTMHCSLMTVALGGVGPMPLPPVARFALLRDQISDGVEHTPERPPDA